MHNPHVAGVASAYGAGAAPRRGCAGLLYGPGGQDVASHVYMNDVVADLQRVQFHWGHTPGMFNGMADLPIEQQIFPVGMFDEDGVVPPIHIRRNERCVVGRWLSPEHFFFADISRRSFCVYLAPDLTFRIELMPGSKNGLFIRKHFCTAHHPLEGWSYIAPAQVVENGDLIRACGDQDISGMEVHEAATFQLHICPDKIAIRPARLPMYAVLPAPLDAVSANPYSV